MEVAARDFLATEKRSLKSSPFKEAPRSATSRSMAHPPSVDRADTRNPYCFCLVAIRQQAGCAAPGDELGRGTDDGPHGQAAALRRLPHCQIAVRVIYKFAWAFCYFRAQSARMAAQAFFTPPLRLPHSLTLEIRSPSLLATII